MSFISLIFNKKYKSKKEIEVKNFHKKDEIDENFFKEKCKLASDLNTSVDVLKSLAMDDNVDVRLHVVLNPNTTDEILRLLIFDKDNGITYNVSIHENASAETLNMLAIDTLEKLKICYDENYEVLIGIASNPQVSIETLKLLAKHDNFWVKLEMVKAFHTPKEILEILKNDEDEEIRNLAKERLNSL